jgi:D-arginine dehydrogenase
VATSDILIVGGGIAGLSAAAALAKHAKVIVLEAEDQVGFHSSGRSATMLHYFLGDRLVRELTLASRGFIENPSEGFADTPLGHAMPVLIFGRESELEALTALESEISQFAELDRLDASGVHELCPLLKGDTVAGLADRAAIRLDPHALLQGNLRALRRHGGALVTSARVAAIHRSEGAWTATTETGETHSAPILINAAGAWADRIATLAGLRPVGLRPLRRTIITFDVPPGALLEGLPFAKTVHDELYFAPESGRLFASPMDEVPSDPVDAQPDDYEVALAAWRMEERTTVKVDRVHSKWAGLRSFTPDRHPAVGFAPDAEGFFWLAGQGGFGLQTSPAIAAIVESLIVGTPWPTAAIDPGELTPGRFG